MDDFLARVRFLPPDFWTGGELRLPWGNAELSAELDAGGGGAAELDADDVGAGVVLELGMASAENISATFSCDVQVLGCSKESIDGPHPRPPPSTANESPAYHPPQQILLVLFRNFHRRAELRHRLEFQEAAQDTRTADVFGIRPDDLDKDLVAGGSSLEVHALAVVAWIE